MSHRLIKKELQSAFSNPGKVIIMKYFNIKNREHKVSFREALTKSISSDKGLYMPAVIPVFEKDFFDRMPEMDFCEIAYEVSAKFIGDEIPLTDLKKICDEAFNFPVILRKLDDRKYVLELFHGPTAAFKDFGARFMSQCFRYFAGMNEKKTVVLVATSGDTGGAIANSFLGIEGVDVVILYPSGKVSAVQEQQLTTQGQNIYALEVKGTFDDCQAMVKSAFTRFDTQGKVSLTSANSINIARLIPQSFYYYFAVSRMKDFLPAISVPCGNFGNITGAMLAWKTGLNIGRFIVSTNINRVVPDYLRSGSYIPRKSILTIANAMDVGDPSNFDRMTELFDNNLGNINSMVSGYWYDDDLIRRHIGEVYRKYGYILDPHGSVASMGLDDYLAKNRNSAGLFVETAHPAKFCDIVEPVIGKHIAVPDSLKILPESVKNSVLVEPEYNSLEDYLKNKYL